VKVEQDRSIVVGETALRLSDVGGMSVQIRVQAEGAVDLTAPLYEFVQALLVSSSEELISLAMRTISQTVPASQRVVAVSWPDLHPLLPDQDATGVSVSMARYAVTHREAILLSEDTLDQPDIAASVVRHGIRSALYVPLHDFGVLCVDTPRPSIPFTADDLQFVRALGALLATALKAERHREEVRRVENEAREHAARRDAMAAFLKIASHDLRNPVGVALQASKMIVKSPGLADSLLPCIVEASERAMDLIHTYLEMAGLDAGQTVRLERSWLDVPALVQGELEFNRIGLSRNVSFVSSVSCSKVYADPQRLRQILGNLLSNAIKYSPEGGTITLEASEGVVFRVRDQGKGIAPEDQERLFRQFERLDDLHKGVGLGLWLTSCLVAAHGGRIWVECAPGEGATLAFTIPPPP
jgi:signal transduction histidine kinase